MQRWLRGMRQMRGLAWAGLIAVLTAAVSRGQTPWGEMPGYGEPPMAEAPPSGQRPAVPPLSPTLPPPTPLPPEQAVPFVPPPPLAAGPLVPSAAVVRLRVQAPARAEPDKEIEYRLTVENVSAVAAHHVWVRDRLPPGVEEAVRAEPKITDKKKTKDGLTDLLWDLGTLKAGDQKVIVLAIKPKGGEDVQNRAYVQFEHGQKVTTHLAKPSVHVKVTVPPQAIRYQPIFFRIDVANTGDAPLRNVVVTDELPASLEFVDSKTQPSEEKPLTWKLGDLLPHQTRRIEYQAISKQTGKFSNKAKVTAGGGTSATDSAAVTVGEAKLKIRVSGPQRRLVNRPIPYHITVGNVGTIPIANVQVADELPGGVEFVTASNGGRREGGFVRWSLGNLSPGELRPLVLVLRAPAPGWCWNEARVQAGRDLSDKGRSEATRIELASAPAIEIDKSTNWLVVGQKATYTIRLFNPGKSNVLHPNVRVAVPDEMSITAQRGATTGLRKGQEIRFDPVEVLDGGEEKVYTIEVEAKKAGEAKLRTWWTDGRHDAGTTETWEDKTIILDPVRMTNRIASRARDLQMRFTHVHFPSLKRKRALFAYASGSERLLMVLVAVGTKSHLVSFKSYAPAAGLATTSIRRVVSRGLEYLGLKSVLGALLAPGVGTIERVTVTLYFPSGAPVLPFVEIV